MLPGMRLSKFESSAGLIYTLTLPCYRLEKNFLQLLNAQPSAFVCVSS